MKSIYIFALLFSTSAFARGYQTGTFTCGTDAAHATTWTIAESGISGIPTTDYNVTINGVQDVAIRALATIEEIAGGTLVGVKGMRGSQKVILFFRNDGRITAGQIECTKKTQ